MENGKIFNKKTREENTRRPGVKADRFARVLAKDPTRFSQRTGTGIKVRRSISEVSDTVLIQDRCGNQGTTGTVFTTGTVIKGDCYSKVSYIAFEC